MQGKSELITVFIDLQLAIIIVVVVVPSQIRKRSCCCLAMINNGPSQPGRVQVTLGSECPILSVRLVAQKWLLLLLLLLLWYKLIRVYASVYLVEEDKYLLLLLLLMCVHIVCVVSLPANQLRADYLFVFEGVDAV